MKARVQAAAALKQTRQQVRQKVNKTLFSPCYKRKWGRWIQGERFEELTQEVEGCKWDALLISETCGSNKAETWETQQGYMFMGAGKIWEQTWSWKYWWTRSGENVSVGQTTSTNEPLQRRSQSTSNVYCWWVCTSPTLCRRTTTLKERTDQSRNSRSPKRRASKLWEEISTLNWGPGLVSNVSVLGRTQSERETREETGWSNSWWYRTSQHLPRCTEKRLNSKLQIGHRQVTEGWSRIRQKLLDWPRLIGSSRCGERAVLLPKPTSFLTQCYVWEVSVTNKSKPGKAGLKLAGKKQNIDPIWKIFVKDADRREPTSFFDHVYFGCTQRECQTSKDIVDTYKCLNPESLLVLWKSNQKIKLQVNLRQTLSLHGPMTWKVMRRNVWKDIANWRIKQLNKYIVAKPCLDDHQFKEEDMVSVGELSTVCSHFFWNACICPVLVELIFYGPWTNLLVLSLNNGPELLTKI